jgi:hypothetical protein
MAIKKNRNSGLFNIDSFHLFQGLWQHPGLAEGIRSAPGGVDVKAGLD